MADQLTTGALIGFLLTYVTHLQSVQTRVLEADPNGGRCLVENLDAGRAVEFCYCVGRSSTDDDSLVCVFSSI